MLTDALMDEIDEHYLSICVRQIKILELINDNIAKTSPLEEKHISILHANMKLMQSWRREYNTN